MTTGLWMVFCSVLVVRMREGVVDRRWRTSDGDDGWFCWVSGVCWWWRKEWCGGAASDGIGN
ncbi:hypothetical protein POPTR_010G096951v4 [Populus trichocarpa]|uniref:Uncharacterized protein n=1 Tax=Populus trichocarpa TaxID=3694 RepID=A0ACC0SBX5_POPTR|nr:hypothetical protein POPTR_010G096951v4 [Populus trichocarpa]